jgi:hypothetical protein
MLFFFAASITAWNLWRLSLMEQLMFFLLKLSEAAPKMATSWAPAARADSKPDKKSMTRKITAEVA